jgi:hypothetical protein
MCLISLLGYTIIAVSTFLNNINETIANIIWCNYGRLNTHSVDFVHIL